MSDVRAERSELQERISRWLDLPLALLALAALALLVIEFVTDPGGSWAPRVAQLQTAVWAVFAIAFGVELALAPSKGHFLRQNWLSAVAVVIPPLRIVRVLRVARAVRGLSLVRSVTAVNRATRALSRIVERGKLGYALAVTVIVAVIGAASALYFERTEATSQIQTFTDALGWSAALLADHSVPVRAVSPEAQVIAILLRLYSLGAVGYLTATFALHLIGGDPERSSADELRLLRREIGELREEIASDRAAAAKLLLER